LGYTNTNCNLLFSLDMILAARLLVLKVIRPSAVIAFFVYATSALAADLVGVASVVDGDTIEIHGERIRIFGIDAPESAQLCRGNDSLTYRCGARAANELDKLVEQRQVICRTTGQDIYRRYVAICWTGGMDIGEWLVRNGLALDWPKYSNGRYFSAQNEAKNVERGIWAGSFVEPWRYRACIKSGGAISDCSDL
jgi:endonuclease YncB( thermonuclease family)